MIITSKEFRTRVAAQEPIDDLSIAKAGYGFTLTDVSNVLTFVFSSKSVDLSGDRVFPKGIDVTNYMARNPIILLHHEMHEFPIGKALRCEVTGDQLVGDILFFTDLDEGNVGTQARAALELIKRGTMGVSITFIPKEFELNTSDGLDILSCECVEISVCTVPCNRDAYLIPTPEASEPISASAREGETVENCIIARDRMAARRSRAISLAV